MTNALLSFLFDLLPSLSYFAALLESLAAQSRFFFMSSNLCSSRQRWPRGGGGHVGQFIGAAAASSLEVDGDIIASL
jgi:hypothetical protein